MSHKLLKGPEFYDNHGQPGAVKYGIDVTVLQDEVTTMAFVTNAKSGVQLATGYARRHPRDERNSQLGRDLAIARALSDLAERYADKAESAITPEPDPMREPLRAMKRANRAEQAKRKNAKRREAREAFLRRTAIAAGETLTSNEIRDALGRSFGDWS